MKFIHGIHPGCNKYYTWKIGETHHACIGDYAIVQNGAGYAMVEIIAVGETSPRYDWYMTQNHGRLTKSVICIIPRGALNGLYRGDNLDYILMPETLYEDEVNKLKDLIEWQKAETEKYKKMYHEEHQKRIHDVELTKE